jgi:hypothetical protein
MSEAPILILHGSQQPYLSIGRYYGGINVYGYDYIYIPPQDALKKLVIAGKVL